MTKKTKKTTTKRAEPTPSPTDRQAGSDGRLAVLARQAHELEAIGTAIAAAPATAFGERDELRRIMSDLQTRLHRHMTSASPRARTLAVGFVLRAAEDAAQRVDGVISAQLPEAHR